MYQCTTSKQSDTGCVLQCLACMRMRTTSMGLKRALPTAPVAAPAAMRAAMESAPPDRQGRTPAGPVAAERKRRRGGNLEWFHGHTHSGDDCLLSCVH